VIWPTLSLSTSVPDTTRRRVVEIHSMADELRMLEEGHVIAVHPCDAALGHADPGGWSEPSTTRRRSNATVRRWSDSDAKSGITCISPPAVRLTIG
jgi:hypothetical protein